MAQSEYQENGNQNHFLDESHNHEDFVAGEQNKQENGQKISLQAGSLCYLFKVQQNK